TAAPCPAPQAPGGRQSTPQGRRARRRRQSCSATGRARSPRATVPPRGRAAAAPARRGGRGAGRGRGPPPLQAHPPLEGGFRPAAPSYIQRPHRPNVSMASKRASAPDGTPRALLSVSDKAGVVEFARRLAAVGLRLVSTGGT